MPTPKPHQHKPKMGQSLSAYNPTSDWSKLPQPQAEWIDILARQFHTSLALDEETFEAFREELYRSGRATNIAMIDKRLCEVIVGPGYMEPSKKKMTREDAFRVCELFEMFGTKGRAAKMVGFHPITFDEFCERDPEVQAAWDQARIAFKEKVYDEVVNRAVVGQPEPKFHKGRVVGYVNKKSDGLLKMLAESLSPEEFRQNYHAEQKAKSETSQINLDKLSQEGRNKVRGLLTEIREVISADMAKDITPEDDVEDAQIIEQEPKS